MLSGALLCSILCGTRWVDSSGRSCFSHVLCFDSRAGASGTSRFVTAKLALRVLEKLASPAGSKPALVPYVQLATQVPCSALPAWHMYVLL